MNTLFTSKQIRIGSLELGGQLPVRIQSMTNTDTNDIEASLKQCISMIQSGSELVRLTTQGEREVDSLELIREKLREKGMDTPLVADIHFRPQLALKAAGVVEKIRINPGNYLKGGTIDSLLPELLNACKQEGTAIRIGVNHGSLAPRIMEEYGDTPAGMVESAMIFLRICQRENMDRVIVSMKSSNPRVMIHSVRMLARAMQEENMHYPLHLGVTEAGDGVDGILKSVTGMAPLLLEGLGDTIRVSLTGPPEQELPVAEKIVALFGRNAQRAYFRPDELAWDPYSYERRQSRIVLGLGGGSRVKIISPEPPLEGEDLLPEQVKKHLLSFDHWKQNPNQQSHKGKILLLERSEKEFASTLNKLNTFCHGNTSLPVIYKYCSVEKDPDTFRIKLAGEVGSLLVDGMVDGIQVEAPHDEAFINECLLGIFQAAGVRITRTEYIACPSCGRTNFDILSRLKEIRQATSHLTTLKIGIMGCIVNGPGEMADADYGYVGTGRGKVSLYKGKKAMRLNLPEKEALEEFIALIRSEGDWIDP